MITNLAAAGLNHFPVVPSTVALDMPSLRLAIGVGYMLGVNDPNQYPPHNRPREQHCQIQ